MNNAATNHRGAANMDSQTIVTTICPKCKGAGRLPDFAHICGGRCFTCNATGRFVQVFKPIIKTDLQKAIETIPTATKAEIDAAPFAVVQGAWNGGYCTEGGAQWRWLKARIWRETA